MTLVHRFDKSLAVEQHWVPRLDDWLRESGYAFRRATPKEQWRGIDRIVRDDAGELVGVEYKCDVKAAQTGNLFFETVSNATSGRAGCVTHQ